MFTVKVSQEKLDEIKTYYHDFLIEAKGEYVYFLANKEGVLITGYLSKKENKKVSFDGKEAYKEASLWDPNIKETEKKVTVKEQWIDLNDQIGSDEVGVGDFLLPMIVVAAYIKKSDISLLKKLGVHDSKKLTDAKILEIGEELCSSIEYSKLTLSNDKYNEMYQKSENINSLKAKMHNRALYNLVKEHPEVVGRYVDQFVNEKKYYDYLNDGNEPQVKDISFKTKGESYFPCVAAASVIARYAFLKEKEKLEAKYGMSFPCGASDKVNQTAKAFLKKFGEAELRKIAKKNFSNYEEVISLKLL